MERAILIAIGLFALVVWRVVFMLLRLRALPAATPPQRHPQWLLPRVDLMTGSGWGVGFPPIDLVRAGSRAEMYLRRVIALTGATQNGNTYILDVGTIRFEVWDSFITRLRGSDRRYDEETCFGPAFQGMPKAEKIATALLQLRNNPGLFEKWAKKDSAFKPDGQPFRREAAMI
jgi:hypothetical protein